MEELKVKFLMGPPDCNNPHIPEYSENYLKELGKVLGIPAACEGDQKSLISMVILNALTGESGFMVNPSCMNSEKKEIIFAHCTLPIITLYAKVTGKKLLTSFLNKCK